MLRQMIAEQGADTHLILKMRSEGATDGMLMEMGVNAGQLARARRNGSFNLNASSRKAAMRGDLAKAEAVGPILGNEGSFYKMTDGERADAADDYGRLIRLQIAKGVKIEALAKTLGLSIEQVQSKL